MPTEIGRYLLLEALGRGTTGIVYKAQGAVIEERTGVARVVALKVPFLTPDAELPARFKRFFREARAMASLDPQTVANVPAIYLVGEDRGIPFYTRELVDGKTLEDLVIAGSIGLGTGCRILRDVANALCLVHRHGIVHRNLHPANVLVTANGDAKLIGFGRARRIDASPPWNASPDIDLQGLHGMLSWLCETIEHPLLKPQKAIQPPGSVTSTSEFANALSAWLETTKGPPTSCR
jgi:serine/threonine protein kinase